MKKVLFLIMTGSIIINLILLFNIVDLRSKVSAQNNIKAVDTLNKDFLNNFFTYKTAKERYEGIKPYMTEQGYNSTLPAGIEIPEDTDESMSVSSRMDKYVGYTYVVDENRIEFINQFSLTTSFNEIASTQDVLVRTILIDDEATKEWKIDEVEFLTTLGAPDA